MGFRMPTTVPLATLVKAEFAAEKRNTVTVSMSCFRSLMVHDKYSFDCKFKESIISRIREAIYRQLYLVDGIYSTNLLRNFFHNSNNNAGCEPVILKCFGLIFSFDHRACYSLPSICSLLNKCLRDQRVPKKTRS